MGEISIYQRPRLGARPKLIGVAKEMDFIGPRPEVSDYVTGNDFSFLEKINAYPILIPNSLSNTKSFLETIKFIMNDYIKIQKSISTNKLPTKIEFVSEIKNILK